MIQKVTAIQDSFDDDLTLVESFRVFVTEGTVTYYAKREASGETLTYYLFNDKILFAAKGKKMKLRESLDLVKTEIKDVMDSSSADGFGLYFFGILSKLTRSSFSNQERLRDHHGNYDASSCDANGEGEGRLYQRILFCGKFRVVFVAVYLCL